MCEVPESNGMILKRYLGQKGTVFKKYLGRDGTVL